jgi:uncharacterized protein YggE
MCDRDHSKLTGIEKLKVQVWILLDAATPAGKIIEGAGQMYKNAPTAQGRREALKAAVSAAKSMMASVEKALELHEAQEGPPNNRSPHF